MRDRFFFLFLIFGLIFLTNVYSAPDTNAPVTTFSSVQTGIDQNITLICTDNNTGCKYVWYSVNNASLTRIKTADYNTVTTDVNTTYFPTPSGTAVLASKLDLDDTGLLNGITASTVTAVIGTGFNGMTKSKVTFIYFDDTTFTTAEQQNLHNVTATRTYTNTSPTKKLKRIELYIYTENSNIATSDDLTISYTKVYTYTTFNYSFIKSGTGLFDLNYFSTDNSDNNEETKTSTFTTYGNVRFNFIDENTCAPVTTTYTINPSINGVTTESATSLDLNLQGVTNQLYGFQFSATGYGTRFYYTDLNQFSSLDFNQLMLQDANAANNITLNIYNATGEAIIAGTPVTITKANYLVGKYLTNGDGAITPFLADLDSNYVFNVEGSYTTSQRPVLVYRPKYDSNFGDISGNWQITLTGPNSTNKYTITTNSQVIAILPNTETLYSAKVCMLSGSVCSSTYFSRTYLLGFKGLVGETSIQPYLNLVADSTLRTLKVLDYTTNQPYPLAKIVITSKTDLGITYTIESLYTDSTGTAGVYITDGMTYTLIANDLTTYTIVPNASTLTYYIYFNFLVLPTETITGVDVNTYNDFNGAEFFVMRNTLFGCSGTSDCFPSALIAIVLTMIILVVATAVTVGNFIGVKGLSLIAFICFTIFFGIGWLPVYIFAFLGSITLLLLVVVQ